MSKGVAKEGGGPSLPGLIFSEVQTFFRDYNNPMRKNKKFLVKTYFEGDHTSGSY